MCICSLPARGLPHIHSASWIFNALYLLLYLFFFRFIFCSCSCVVRAPVGTLAVALPLRPLSLCLCLAHSVACPSIRLMNLLAHVGSVVIWSSFVAFVFFGAELEIKQKRETEIKSVLYLLQPFCGGCYPTNCH